MRDQLQALQRIANFSAAVRGHFLGEWCAGAGHAHARCLRCGAELRIYLSPIQPEMDGDALVNECARRRTEERVA